MRTERYRVMSHWFLWEDLDFPNTGIKNKILKRAKDASEAGVQMVIIFGFHFRADFVYCFDTVHALFKFTVDAYHQYGIKVLDHHSVVLTHRPRNWAGREHTFERNHHHVPLTPTAEMIPFLQYEGVKFNDCRELRIDDNTPVFIEGYQSEVFCINNPDFRRIYISYVRRLFAETGIDGIMSDDVGHYGHWGSCGCVHCRTKFRVATGKSLPSADDWNFWGNYSNPLFRRWVQQHRNDGADFLKLVRDAIGPDKILISCCSNSTHKFNDPAAIDMAIWGQSMNATMLEMCGNMSGGRSVETRIPDILLNRNVSERKNACCLGLGYAYYPDEGFLIWSMDRFFDSDIWLSSHKPRLGITNEEMKTMPDEPEIVSEAYRYEKKYPELFVLEDTAKIGIWFSSNSRSFNGSGEDDYSTGFRNVVLTLFHRNAAMSVNDVLPDAQQRPVVIAADCGCASEEELARLEAYHKAGGTLLISGRCGDSNELGDWKEESFLKQFGIELAPPATPLTVSAEERGIFFDPWGWNARTAADLKRTAFRWIKEAKLVDKALELYELGERIYWTPRRMTDQEAAERMADFALRLAQPEVAVKAHDQLNFRIYKDAKKDFVIHCMPKEFHPEYHPVFKMHSNGERVVTKLTYAELTGSVTIQCPKSFSKATLYSPDRPEPLEFPVKDGVAGLDVSGLGLRRFFSVKLS